MATDAAQGRSLDLLVEDFLDHIVDYRDYSEATARAYRRDCERFCDFVQDTDGKAVAGEIKPLDVRLFLKSRPDLSSSTIRRRLYALSSFFGYLRNIGLLDRNPAAPVDPPKCKRTLPNVPDRRQCERLLEACETERESAAVGLMLLAGLRRSEVLGLQMADLAADLSMITVRGKGGAERAIPVSQELQAILDDYLAVREADATSLILNEVGSRMQPTSLYRLFHRIVERAGLEDEGITPHSLRHAFASSLVREGVDVATISQLLGHSNIATTSIYLHATPEGKRDAVESLSFAKPLGRPTADPEPDTGGASTVTEEPVA